MEFVRFIFSSVWIWLGFVVLLAVAVDGIVKLATVMRGARKIKVHYFGKTNTKVVEIAAAKSGDVDKALTLDNSEKEETEND